MLDREPRRFWYVLGALVCLCIVLIALRGRLGYYIHPRYYTFTVITSTIGTLVLFKAAISYVYTKEPTIINYGSVTELVAVFGKWLLSKGAWFVIIAIILLAWAPARPLMSGAANRRQQQAQEATSESKKALMQTTWFANPKTINQISQVLSIEEGQKELEGKKFNLTGFVRADQSGDSDIFQLSRFTITCCAVDATPSSLRVYMKDWKSKYPVDSWVKVEGSFKALQTSRGQQLLLSGGVQAVSQPDEPYDYLSF